MLPNMNTFENGWSNFSVNFRVVALKFPNLIQFILPNHQFSSIFYMPLLAQRRHHESPLSLHSACIYLP